MAIHQKAFREELYIEHIEEAAFQYETRLAWLEDEEVGWQELVDIDDNLEAHIDALTVGGKLALQMCLENLAEADASMLHVIVRLFCRYRLIENLSKLWIDFDFDDSEKINSVADALKWECPQEWVPHLVNVFNSDNVQMFPVLASSVSQYSRDSGLALLQAVNKTRGKDLVELIRAISLCNKEPILQQSISALTPYLDHADVNVIKEAARALLIMGDKSILSTLNNRVDEFPFISALAGGLAENKLLLNFAVKGTADGDCLIALGVLGSLESVPNLLAYLKHPDYAPMAALALQLISGASLYEDLHEADDVEEDELFEHELEGFKRGELPKNIDGNPYGNEVCKLSIKQAVWQEWFKSNQSRFKKGIRYRNGNPYSPTELLNNLIDNQSSLLLRELAYSELTIRYGLTIPFTVNDLVYKQQQMLNEIHNWIMQTKQTFTDGNWYFNGQIL